MYYPLSSLRRTCYVRTSADERAKLLWDLPGVKVYRQGKGHKVTCYPDAVLPVRNVLSRLGLPADISLPEAFAEAWKRRADMAWGEETLRASTDLAPLVDNGRGLWEWLVTFQREETTRTTALGGGHLWQPPGAGKTVQEVVASFLVAGPGTDPILFITKAAVRYQFARQVRRFTIHKPYVAHPSAPPLGSYLQSCGPTRQANGHLTWERRPVLVFSWTDLVTWWEDLVALQIKVLLLDETHLMKAFKRAKWVSNADGRPEERPLNNMSWAAGQLCTAIPHVIGGTATEIDNALDDLWSQLDGVQPGCWGKTGRKLVTRYASAIQVPGRGLQLGQASHVEELQLRLSVIGHRLNADVTHAGIPAKTRSSVWIPQEAQVQAKGSWTAEFTKAEKLGDRAERDDQLKLLRVAHAASRKRNAVVEFVVDRLAQGQKVLLLDMWRANCTTLYERIAKAWKHAVTEQKGPRPGPASCGGIQDPRHLENLWLVMGGRQQHRDWVQRRYMGVEMALHPGPACVIGTIDAIGTGLDWHDSDMLGFSCLPYKHGTLEQAEDRVWRRGLLKRVEIVYFFAEGTYDERLVEILDEKADHVAAVGNRSETVAGTMDALRGVKGHEEELHAGLLDFVENSEEGDW